MRLRRNWVKPRRRLLRPRRAKRRRGRRGDRHRQSKLRWRRRLKKAIVKVIEALKLLPS